MSNSSVSPSPSPTIPAKVSKLSNFPQSPEVYAYNVIFEQDPDILNQGTLSHVKKYFDKKEREEADKGKNTYDTRYITVPKGGAYSINSVSFVIKLIVLMFFMMIAWNFLQTN